MKKKFRFAAVLLAAVMFFVMLSSIVYIAAESDHACTGADCAICYQINICENIIRHIGIMAAAAVALSVSACAMRRIASLRTAGFRPFTPVMLKVKLTD